MTREIDRLGSLLIELDDQGCVLRANRAACALLGEPEAKLIGGSFIDRHLPKRVRARVQPGRAGTDSVVLPILDAAGREHTLLWSISAPEPQHKAQLWSGVQWVDDLSLELADMKRALDASTIVAITDPNGTITFVNEKFVEISKYSREELIGQTHRIVNSGHHPQSFFKQMWAMISKGKTWRGDIKNKARDGSYYWVATTIVPFLDERGKPYQYLSLRHEITERKTAEEALALANQRILDEQSKLVQAEKLSSIGMLVAGIAHEVNNPLSGVIGCVKMLRDQSMSDERRSEYFRTSLDGLERIQQTMRGLLDFSRQRPVSPERVDLSEVVASSLKLVAPALRKKDLQIQSAIEPIDLCVHFDRAQLLQALVNILLNAAYASPLQSSITIQGARRDALAAQLIIADEGPGIPPEIIDRVFDPFFSTKPDGEGTGLGLSITLGLIRGNGGDLAIHSAVGSGTRVELSLPLSGEK